MSYVYAPNSPILSINKHSGTPNDIISITWNTVEYADSYWLHIYRNGEDYINQTLNQELSYSAKYPVGNYTLCIVSCNGIGETISSVDFSVYDSSPEKPFPQINKNIYYTYEIVEITWNETSNTDHYWLHSYRNGEEYENKDLYKSLSYSAKYPVGEYTVYIVSFNELGEALSSINFNVIKKGDINGDGKLNAADVVFLQKWLVAVPDVKLADWKAADLCEDGKLNVFDLCILKRMIING
ncbi:MAG: dockerin type I repeat-containing protein [Clostridium sp.]|nr:dockerin type I repeat-containing protein [Clostridium sp.]